MLTYSDPFLLTTGDADVDASQYVSGKRMRPLDRGQHCRV